MGHLRFEPQAPPLALVLPAPSAGLYAATPASLPKKAFTSAALKPFTDCSGSAPVMSFVLNPLLAFELTLLCAHTLFGGWLRAASCLGGCDGFC